MRLLKKGTKLYSILKLKCPRCQEGNLFISKNPYNFNTFDKMATTCPVCGENFEKETGFYYGAMMISHASTTLIAVFAHSIMFYFYRWDYIEVQITIIIVILLSLFPITFRSSRAIWINFFVKCSSNKTS